MHNYDNKATVNQLAHTLLGYMADETTHQIDYNLAIDPAEYTDPARFEQEKYGLFRKTPLFMGFSCDLPENGSFKLNEDSGVSVLLTRNKAGQVKAFLNACTHRGAKLTEEPCGNKARFTCPFHAWTFTNDGDLLAINKNSYFGDVDKSQMGLVELPCDEKYGMIFVILTPGMTMDIDAWLGAGRDYIAGWHFENNSLAAERDLVTTANWKITLDTFCEGYHFPVLHAKDFHYKAHYCAHHWKLDENRPHWAVAWPSQSLETLRNVPEAQWDTPNQHFSIIHFIYPNTIIGLYPETCSVWSLYPGKDPSDQVTRMKYYSRLPNASTAEKAVISERLELFYKVLQTEDYWVSNGIHQNIASGVAKPVTLGRNEPGVAWVHESLNAGLEAL